MEQEKKGTIEKEKNNSELAKELTTEILRMQFCFEVLSDIIAHQQKRDKQLEEMLKLMRDRKRKKRRKYWEETNGAEHQKNQ